MKELYILRGVPGAGKSTLAKSIGGIHIESDQYFMEGDKYNFDITKLQLAHDYCQSQTREWMIINNNPTNTDKIVVSNTFTREWEMKPYFDLAEEFGYRVYSIIVENRRNGKNIHNVPDDVIENMVNRFEIKLK